ncbi:unnamed protein product [Echinostoma caproni]|uniref:PDZ domain-containing protein n=1 Tax=Echinostoma caproni TaxID=27848 RepID=A0A183A681_9TREM|nr:unnamed protein product [Echinostoma caproni]
MSLILLRKRDEVAKGKYLLNKYSELEGEILTVEIPLSQLIVEVGNAKVPHLGLCLAGNRDLNQMSVFVCGIRPGSLVERDGRIELGDQLLEVNDHTLYGLSHLNAAPIIRSVYLEAVQGSNRIFRRTKLGSIRFVIQRCSGNLLAMAATAGHLGEVTHSAKSSRRSSTETVLSILSTPQKSGYDNSKAKRSLEFMELAFGEKRGPLLEHTVFITLTRGSSGFGFAIMEGSPTNEEGIFVKQVIPNGPAALDGQLCPGDRLIRVNKRDATHASYESVLEWIRSAKHELRLQVQRWCFRPQLEKHDLNSLRNKNQKRFSAPQLLGSLAAAIRGSGDAPTRRPRSSHDQRDSLGSGRMALEPVLENDGPRITRLNPNNLSSQIRRASSPNLQSWHTNSNEPPSLAHLSVDIGGALAAASKRSSVTTVKSLTIAVQEPRPPPQPAEPAATRPILPGADTVIELEVEPGHALGIGFIGGAETALPYDEIVTRPFRKHSHYCLFNKEEVGNVLVVHELYAKGLAVKDARLRPGDQILRVNGTPLVGLPFIEAVNRIYSAHNEVLLKPISSPDEGNTSDGTENMEIANGLKHVLTLEVRRPQIDQSKWYDQEITVELAKKSGKGLGIGIADRCVYSHHTSVPQKENGQMISDHGPNSHPDGANNPSYGVIITDIVSSSVIFNFIF